MTRSDARALLLATLARIAPGADASGLGDSADLRRELDLDSFDMLQLLTELSKSIDCDIPERDYSCLATLGGAVDYLARARPTSAGDASPTGGEPAGSAG